MYNQENTAMKFVFLTINTKNELEGVEAGVKNSQEVKGNDTRAGTIWKNPL